MTTVAHLPDQKVPKAKFGVLSARCVDDMIDTGVACRIDAIFIHNDIFGMEFTDRCHPPYRSRSAKTRYR
jgi:hypothetical protein